jgi:hypothetical protein
MRRIVFLAVLIGLGSVGLLWGSPEKGAGGRADAKSTERPCFSAATVQIRKQRLIVTDLQPIEKEATSRQKAGRVLIRCSPEVALKWWASQVGINMARATPFLGYERPGTTFLKIGPQGKEERAVVIPFDSPVRVTLVYLNHKGCAERKRSVMIKEVEER